MPGARRTARRPAPLLLAIIVACLGPEIVLSGADLGLWGAADWRIRAFQNAGFWAGLLRDWRANYPFQPLLMFVSYGFLHSGAIHAGVNMATLLSLGPPLLERMGGRRFALLYGGALAGGAAGFALLSAAPLPMVGASGALFGLAGAHVALHWRSRRLAGDPLAPVGRALLGLVALNLVLWWAMQGMLAWQTHLGGFLAGAALALRLDRERG